MSFKEELIEQFGNEVDKSDVIAYLENLIKIYALNIEELFIKWEQFSYHRHETHTAMNTKNLDGFKNFLQKQIEKKAQKFSNTSNVTSSGLKSKIIGSSPSLFGFNSPRTPIIKKRKLNETQPTSSGQKSSQKLGFSSGSNANNKSENIEKSNTTSPSMTGSTQINLPSDITVSTPSPLKRSGEAGVTLDSLNPNNIETSEGFDPENDKKVKITPFYDPIKYKFRTMRQNLQDAADVLDEQIEIFCKLAKEHFKLSQSDFGDPTIQSQSEIYAVGRIVPDSPTAEGFLNIDSLALEASRLMGIGRRVRLNFSKINECSLFCGQIIVLKGKNADGDYFMVDEILNLPYPDSPVSTVEDIENSNMIQNGKSMKVIITSGPYFPENDFNVQPIKEFVDKINNKIKPHTLIMFGPFIDITQNCIAKGAIPQFHGVTQQPRTLDEIFTKVLVPLLSGINSSIQVILVPSTRDAISHHAAYPQDSFDRKKLQLPKNFKCFTNPSTFQLNEVFFGCSNVDIYKDLKEVAKGGNTAMRNRFDRVSEHVLQQRRYYPVFPGGIRKTAKILENKKKVIEHISGADLEVPYLGLTEFVGEISPDVIIMPSEMQHFARVVQNVVMINPGRFVRPNGGRGTFAEMTIEPPNVENGKLTKMSDEDLFLHNVWKRSRIDIITN
ncbi:hypothetical protein TPHA_0M01400 [Tetrapisispora phaffii CBS 4417]|uniref:DNA polymerase alpha subunit B n=1 Tax=Tetrapisispora phaffii (strain ATCC 24235 / CBS 4417 / NBRC 1672 / NRRL Y-8282 / UCD 70-5) TaxID=1071381 RepID=G8C0K0_TETPH|nr:hypothetical protein TPHA_0M01400 [Tetrapisispora phaffii CBS 4417]CCE65715.1 hypothetical protein TPHA_0M01400 [Tetrapisispora phaffii CBS 4417]